MVQMLVGLRLMVLVGSQMLLIMINMMMKARRGLLLKLVWVMVVVCLRQKAVVGIVGGVL